MAGSPRSLAKCWTINNTSGAPITLANNNAIVVAGDFAFSGTNALSLGGGAVTIGSGIPTQTISISNNSTLPGTSLTFGGAVSGANGAAVTLNISGTGNTAFTGNVTKGGASSLVINNSLPGTLTISGSASNITTLNATGGESSIIEIGAGNLTFANGGGSIIQSTTGATINATGGGSIILGSANGDFGTAGGTTLTVNAKISGANAVDFYNANAGVDLGIIVLNANNDYTGATRVENTRVRIPASGGINTANTAGVGQVSIGTVGSNAAVLELNGGTIHANNGGVNVLVGTASGANGVLNISSGTLTAAAEFWVGAGAGSFGTLKMSGGTVSSGAWFVIGRDSSGTADMSGGTINVTNRNFIVAATGVRGVADLYGSAVVNVTATGAGNGSVYVGEAFQSSPSIGELNLSGSAAVNIAGGDGLFLGVNSGGSGTVNFNGGTLTTPLVKKGVGFGAVNFNGGTLKSNAANATFLEGLDTAYINQGGAIIDDGGNAITVAQPLLAPTGNGIGSIAVSNGINYVGVPTVEILGDGTGATAVAKVDGSGNLIGITVTNPGVGYTDATAAVVGGGGFVTVDSVTLKPNVSGGLTKRGTGTVTLSGANTYTGPTVIEAGTLAISGSISGSQSITTKSGTTLNVETVPGGFALANGQKLQGNGTVVGNVTMSEGSKLAPGEGPGTITFAGNLDLTLTVTPANSAALQFEFATIASSDKATVTTGSLTIGTGVLGFSDFSFSAIAGLEEGTYTLFDTSTTIVGTLDSANLSGAFGPGFFGTLGFADGGHDLVLTVIPEPGSAALLLGGLSMLAGLRVRRRRA
jgi:autotransporter-associated beta strand protein